MKWIRRPKPRRRPDPDKAKRELEEIRSRREDVDQLIGELRQHRIENHFAQRVFSLTPREQR